MDACFVQTVVDQEKILFVGCENNFQNGGRYFPGLDNCPAIWPWKNWSGALEVLVSVITYGHCTYKQSY